MKLIELVNHLNDLVESGRGDKEVRIATVSSNNNYEIYFQDIEYNDELDIVIIGAG